MARFFLVLKDLGPTHVGILLYREIIRRGHEVQCYAEGNALGLLYSHEITFHDYSVCGEEAVSVAFDEENPDGVIVGLSYPTHLEKAFAAEGNRRGVPVVFLEDFWGASCRLTENPRLVLTVNRATALLTSRRHPQAAVVPIGFQGASLPIPSEEVVRRMSDLKSEHGAVLLFTDGGDQAAPELSLLLACLRKTHSPFVLIPKWHPKFENALRPGSLETWGKYWESILESDGRGIPVVRVPDVPTSHLAVLADATFSGFSSILITAASARRHAVTLWTRVTAERLREESGLDRTPLMVEGGFPVVDRPVPLRFDAEPVPFHIESIDAVAAVDALLRVILPVTSCP